MSKTTSIKVTDARANFSRILDSVANDQERFIIRKGNIPVAAIVPVSEASLKRDQRELPKDHYLYRFREAFADVDPNEFERELSAAVAEARQNTYNKWIAEHPGWPMGDAGKSDER